MGGGAGDKMVVAEKRIRKKRDIHSAFDNLVESRRSELKQLTHLENFMYVFVGTASVSLVVVVASHLAGRM